MGVSAVSALFYGQRGTLITISGVLMIGFGLLQLLGGGFTLGPLARLRPRVRGDSAGAVFALGAVYGFAGLLLWPHPRRGPDRGGGLRRGWGVARFSWPLRSRHGRPSLRTRPSLGPPDLGAAAWLRGREISLGPSACTRPTSFSGLMFVAIGILFIVYDGTSSLESLYASGGATDLALSVERSAGNLCPSEAQSPP